MEGVDPDDAFSSVPYEKGSALLYYLETLLGGPEAFEPFLKAYVQKFQYQSIDSSQWKEFLYSHFASQVLFSCQPVKNVVVILSYGMSHSYNKGVYMVYCGWLKFRGVPIFVVFVEGPNHEFQYPRNGNFLYELWKKILWPQILNPTNVSFLFNPRKLVPTKIKPSTVYIKLAPFFGDLIFFFRYKI